MAGSSIRIGDARRGAGATARASDPAGSAAVAAFFEPLAVGFKSRCYGHERAVGPARDRVELGCAAARSAARRILARHVTGDGRIAAVAAARHYVAGAAIP